MPDEISFLVQGSQPDPYVVRFFTRGDSLLAKCTCQAGVREKVCKHVLKLIEESVSPSGAGDSHIELAGLRGFGDVVRLLAILRDREREVDSAKSAEKAAKSALQRALAGNER